MNDDNPIAPVEAAVRTGLAALAEPVDLTAHAPPTRIAVALSGGRDSIALLDALARIAPERGIALSARHVHHGLSPRADAWAAFCADACARRGVPLAVIRVAVQRAPGASLEATARAARYAALADTGVDVVALAHHADDQAETLLLQLLRGAGPHGLGAMPALRGGPAAPRLWRPLLALPRAAIDAYAAARNLAFIDDESNLDARLRRNLLRHDVAPRLAAAFAGYPLTLVRAAAHQAEAARLLDDLAAIDAAAAIVAPDDAPPGAPPMLDRAALRALAPERARNLLRWFLRRHRLPAPSAARLAAMHAQLVHAAPGTQVRLVHAGAELGIHRGRVVVHAPPVAPYAVRWQGEAALDLPHGRLEWIPAVGAGVAVAALQRAPVVVRPRRGGEHLQLAADRPRRSLQGLLQATQVPHWARTALPLVFCGDALAAVPGLGIDVAFQAAAGAAGVVLGWHERAAAAPDAAS